MYLLRTHKYMLMKKIIAILALSVMALASTSCLSFLFDNDGSGSSELEGTTWRLNSPGDSVYHQDVVYTVSFGSGNEISFNRNIGGANTLMVGTYTYSKGSGKCSVHYSTGEDQADYRFKFSISGEKMDFTFNLRTITLTKV